ncbi:peptidase inhibitor family I36 protein [Streptomyces sp. NPDC017988]|uniref:peptidase inhibitor family I36 protein n=1 Tax=Streptomyces sp. NPDC017988 TaxID=3365025 RepID=UPI00378F98C3
MLLLSLGITAPANAGTPGSPAADPYDCSEGYVCLWSGYNYDGAMETYQPSWHTCSDTPFEVHSIANRTQDTWTFYTEEGCSGDEVPLGPGGFALSGAGFRSWR